MMFTQNNDVPEVPAMYVSPDFDSKPSALKNRIKMEQRIVKLTVKTLINAGYELSVFDGEEQSAWTGTDVKMLHDALMNTDEDYLYTRKDGKKSFVQFVYGNDGWDVICDHGVSLTAVLAPVTALTDKLQLQ
jgi:hypothetical protein